LLKNCPRANPSGANETTSPNLFVEESIAERLGLLRQVPVA
jgi:hypothetical protein